ncbi:MAG: MTH895/ArsE family thioredoxin-like protein [Rhodospirillales bacterium]|jgi:small redox-active disulfide protein 2|nr:MTH895/ArsE family thioredoxin-like protein [Rhodospirillales bacterium]
MKIQILGGGCAKCHALAQNAEAAANDLGLTFEMEKITDMNRYADFGVAMTPALAVDGQVKVVGKVASVDQIKALLR